MNPKSISSYWDNFKNTDVTQRFPIHEPKISKLIQPTWTKTLLLAALTFFGTCGSFYLYNEFIRPLINLLLREREQRALIETQNMKIANLTTNVENLQVSITNLKESLQLAQQSMDSELSHISLIEKDVSHLHSLVNRDFQTDFKVELAEIKGMLNNRTEYIPMERSYQEIRPKEDDLRVKEVKPSLPPPVKESFDDLFNEGMNNRGKNPYLSDEEVDSVKSSPKVIDPKAFEDKVVDIVSMIKPFQDELLKENEEEAPEKISQEEDNVESETIDQEVFENFQREAEPKLKNSKLMQFISTQVTQKKDSSSTDVWNELYQNTPLKTENPEKQELPVTPNVDPTYLFSQFDVYAFDQDEKFQSVVKEALKNVKLQENKEDIERVTLKLKGKYFKKYINDEFSMEAYTEFKKSDTTPYSSSYVDIITKLQNGETLDDIKTVNDKPKNSTPIPSTPKLVRKLKPWEKKRDSQTPDVTKTPLFSPGPVQTPIFSPNTPKITQINVELNTPDHPPVPPED